MLNDLSILELVDKQVFRKRRFWISDTFTRRTRGHVACLQLDLQRRLYKSNYDQVNEGPRHGLKKFLTYTLFYKRRIQTESTTGSTANQRVRLTLTITVEGVDFDPNVGLLRINGRVASENQYVKVRKETIEIWIAPH